MSIDRHGGRHLSVTGYEFRASTQAALLRNIARWFSNECPKSFLVGVHLDLREEDMDDRRPYTATVFIDGPPAVSR